MPMRITCIIELSRSFERLETDQVRPNHRPPGRSPRPRFACRPPPAVSGGRKLKPVLADHVGQETQKARALDGLRQLALLLRRHRGDAARHDLAALGHIALQEPRVLVVDLRSVGAGERAGLAPAEERTPCAATTTAATRTATRIAARRIAEC